MQIRMDTIDVVAACDDCMHAAQYLVGVPKFNYGNPKVWKSTDPAVVLLRERYQFLHDFLEYVWDNQEDSSV